MKRHGKQDDDQHQRQTRKRHQLEQRDLLGLAFAREGDEDAGRQCDRLGNGTPRIVDRALQRPPRDVEGHRHEPLPAVVRDGVTLLAAGDGGDLRQRHRPNGLPIIMLAICSGRRRSASASSTTTSTDRVPE